MFNLFLPVAIALAALIDAQTGVRIINLDGLFRADDYPASAVDEDHEGTTTIRLTISPNGTVGSCTIVESSGHAALDERSCAIYRARARFEPARDSKGRTVASQFEQRVVWKLDGEAPVPMPRQAWMTRSTMAASIERRIISCEAEAVGLSSQPFDCKALMELAERDNFLASKGVPIAAYVINEVYFYPLPAAKATGPPAVRDTELQKQQVSEIVIGPDGRVTACKGIRYAGGAAPDNDACSFVKRTRFKPAPGGPDLVGTVAMTIYGRTIVP